MSSASPMHKFCVGTLVSSKYVVTAAQCVHQRPASRVFSMLGEFYLGATGETPTLEHVLTIDRIILHEFFDPATLAYDIALLELAAAVDLSVFTPFRVSPGPRTPSPGSSRRRCSAGTGSRSSCTRRRPWP